MQERQFGLVDLLLIGTAVIWGVNVVAVKLALAELSPLVFNTFRFITSAALSWALLLWKEPGSRLDPKDLPAMIWLGFLGNTLYQLLFISGINLTSAGNTSLLLAAIPMWVALLSGLLGLEKIRAITWLGLVLSFGGILLVTVGGGKEISFGSATSRGDLMIIAGTLLNAYYTVKSKRLLERYSTLQFSAYTMTTGAVGLIIASFGQMRSQNWGAVGIQGWGGLAFSAIGAITIGSLLWNNGIKLLGPARTAIYNNLSPVVSLFSSWLILSERIALPQILGALLIIGGLYVARSTGFPWQKRPQQQQQAV